MAEVNYSVVFEFEKNFEPHDFLQWMNENWTLSFWFSALYVLIIFSGKYYMEQRPKYELRPALALWSAILAVFSIMGAVRTLPQFSFVLTKRGFHHSVCNPDFFSGVSGFWAAMFILSKVYELGDTVFIVLRKQQLIFLHWYHHISVMIYCWYSYTDHTAPGRWFMVMNYLVHSFMYTYYALRAMRFKIPRWVNVVITSMQLLQMIIGTALNVYIYNAKMNGNYCQQTYENLRYSLMMYFSYFVLFGHYFYNAYILSTKPSMDIKKSQ